MARVTYSGDSVTLEWMAKLAEQPGEVWVESQSGGLILVHEFNDLSESKRSSYESD